MVLEREAVAAERVDQLRCGPSVVLGEGDQRTRAGGPHQMTDLGVAGAVAETHHGEPGALGGDERHVHRDPVGQQEREARVAW